ncbi:DUF7467 domain-containing protein [Stieleria maiorica]|nr:SdrD B-like domain-containing protein [Stieleria maiorica]
MTAGQAWTNQENGDAFEVGSTVRTVGTLPLSQLINGAVIPADFPDELAFSPGHFVVALEGNVTGPTSAEYTAGSLYLIPSTNGNSVSYDIENPASWNFENAIAKWDLGPAADIADGVPLGVSHAGPVTATAAEVNLSELGLPGSSGNGLFVFLEDTSFVPSGVDPGIAPFNGSEFVRDVEAVPGLVNTAEGLAAFTDQTLDTTIIPLTADQISILDQITLASAGVTGAFSAGGYTPVALGTDTGDFSADFSSEAYVIGLSGDVELASLGDFVWEDLNADGIQDAGEPGINGVTVKLLDSGGNVLQTTTTGAGPDDPTTPGDESNGYYEFTGLTPGVEYTVMFVNPDDVGPDAYMFSAPLVGGDSTVDSNVTDPVNGTTPGVILSSGEFNRTIDAGLFRKGSIHAYGFLDINGDGIENGGDDAFPDDPGKTFVLNGPGGTQTRVTVSGEADWVSLTPGTYTISEDPIPPGFSLTTTPNLRTFVVQSGEELVYEPGAADLPAGDTRTEVVLGDLLKWGNTELASLGDFVWEDLNADGIQDAGEPGINGVTVKLLDSGGNVLQTTTTGAGPDDPTTPGDESNGYYEFTGLTPGVEYTVMFVNPDDVGPDAYMFSAPLVGGDSTVDSNVTDPVNGTTPGVILSSGEFNRTIDAGLFRKGSIHAYGFLDINGDGIENGGDDAFPDDPGKTFVLNGPGGTQTRVTVSGEADWVSLTPGTYTISEDPIPPGFALTTTPNLRTFVVQSGEELVYEPGAADLPAGDTRTEVVLGDLLKWGNTEVAPAVGIEKFTRIDVNPIDIEKLVRVESPAIQGDVCDVLGKPVGLTFQYIPSLAFNPLQPDGKAGVLVNNSLDDDGTSYVVVSKNGDPTNFGDIFFQGNVTEGELFTAAGAFGSNTYFFFFDEQGGPLLQSFKYHTSCSAPIILGAQPLSATLVGYNDGTPDGDVQAPNFGPGINDADADAATGPEATVGDTVVFTYVVTNPIADTELSNILVTDLVLAPLQGIEFAPDPVLEGGLNVGDTDGDGKLDFGEQWLYTSTTSISATTPVGQHVDKATVTGTSSAGGQVMDMDPAHFIINPATTGEDLCDVDGKVVGLTFEYIPGISVNTDQDSGKASVIFDSGMVDGDGASWVIVTDENDASKALAGEGRRHFVGMVAFNEQFEANENIDDFGSNTYIHFFDSAYGGLLQTVNYHTSCSQPIVLGDVIGNATLVGYEGESGSSVLPPTVDPPVIDFGGVMLTTDAPFDPGNLGFDADEPSGPVAQLGDKVTWTYVVTNPGGVPLTINSVFDDNETDNEIPGLGDDDFEPAPVLTSGGFNFGDVNENGLLDPGEEWYFQAMEIVAETGQHKNTAKVRAEDASGTMVMDSDMSNHIVNPLVFEKYVSVPTPPSGEDQCDINGKPVNLSFEYVPGTTVVTSQGDKATASGTPDDDGESYILVDGGDLFAGVVAEGAVFTIGGDFGSNTVFEIYDDLAAFQSGQSPLQVLEYHTSCSQVIQLGDLIGSVILVTYEGEDGTESRATGLGDPADSPSGPRVIVGDEVVFNYEITNSSSGPNAIGLTDVSVFDSVLGTITEIVDNGNGDNVLDPGETWVLTASTEATVPGLQFNLGTVTALGTTNGPLETPLTVEDGAYHYVETLKFFVVDNDADATFAYSEGGLLIGSTNLVNDNSDPRGATSNAAGDKVWVIDKDKYVYVYNSDGSLAGSWKGDNTSDKVQGIATDGTNIWIVEEDRDVFFYAGGAGFLGGTRDETTKFKLENSNIDKPTGLTTDGTHLWVVDEKKKAVFKYTTTGTFVASWALAGDNSKPKGVTLNPADPGDGTLWVVDQDDDMIYAYADGKSDTGGTLIGTFALASANSKAEGIADPIWNSSAPIDSGLAYDVNGDGAVTALDALQIINHIAKDAASGERTLSTSNLRYDVSGDLKVTVLDALRIINQLARNEATGPEIPTSESKLDYADAVDVVFGSDSLEHDREAELTGYGFAGLF